MGVTKQGDEQLVKSRQRVTDHGEVFTPEWAVDAMLDLVNAQSERIDSRFLEPACGSGNFLVRILRRKLTATESKYGRSDFERRHYALLAVMSIYGIEMLPDNVQECRANMLELFADFNQIESEEELFHAGAYVLSQNIIHGDALTMLTDGGEPIAFAEWGYLGKGKFQRRDFHFDTLTQSAAFTEEGTLFANLGADEIFVPFRSHAVTTIRDLAVLAGASTPNLSSPRST